MELSDLNWSRTLTFYKILNQTPPSVPYISTSFTLCTSVYCMKVILFLCTFLLTWLLGGFIFLFSFDDVFKIKLGKKLIPDIELSNQSIFKLLISS